MSAPRSDLSAPNFDSFAAFPEARAVCDAAKARDWDAIDAGVSRFVDPAEHNHILFKVSETAELSFLEEVFAADPTSALAGTLLAQRLIADGWDIRTSSLARYVSPEQWKGFREHLHRAEQILIDVTARYPDYTSAWISRQTIAMGLSLGQAEARRRYAAITKVAPDLVWAQLNMIQQLCPKWRGSYKAMRGFAVECTKASPPGSVNGMVVPDAHIEHWLQVASDYGDPTATAYLKQPNVQQELLWAAGHSVLNPAHRQAIGFVNAHCAFAMVFSLAENYPAAAAHFSALYTSGNLAVEWPWKYLGDASTEFTTYRDLAFRKGLSR